MIKAGLFGRPLSKSLSPRVFGVFSKLTGSAISYEARECGAEGLQAAVSAAKAEGWTGFNATIPHKRALFGMLASADKSAGDTGAANAARFGKNGLEGTNPDAYALQNALKERGLSVRNLPAAVFGAGGAAASSVWALAGAGAGRVDICARKPAEAQKLAAAMAIIFPDAEFGAMPFNELPPGHVIFVNATPLGMYSDGLPPCAPRSGDICVDLAYAAGGTEFMKAALAAGAHAVDGLDLLVWQAALTLEFWGGFPGGDIVKFKQDAAALLARRLKEKP